MNPTIIRILFICAILLGTHAANAKTIALSFDDAPRGQGPIFNGDQRSIELIKQLQAVNTGPVAFFVTTKNLDLANNRARIHRYADTGHLIANHSHNHKWLRKTEAEDYLKDIDQAESLLNGFKNRRPWFRFPYLDEGRDLAKRDKVREELAKRKLDSGYVTVDNYDWYIEAQWQKAVDAGKKVDIDALREVYIEMLMSAIEFYDQMAVEALNRSPHHVLLLHENDLAALFIGDLVKELHENGWKIISPDQAFTDEIAQYQPKTMRTGQGRISGIANDQLDAANSKGTLTGGTTIKSGSEKSKVRMTHLAIDETLIDQLLEKKNVFYLQK